MSRKEQAELVSSVRTATQLWMVGPPNARERRHKLRMEESHKPRWAGQKTLDRSRPIATRTRGACWELVQGHSRLVQLPKLCVVFWRPAVLVGLSDA